MADVKKEKFGLEDPISETALLTMYFKALETRRPDPILEDPMAVEILRKLGVDMSRFAGKRMSQVGTVIRARGFDRQVRRVLGVGTAGYR